jgi:hypothetical protein
VSLTRWPSTMRTKILRFGVGIHGRFNFIGLKSSMRLGGRHNETSECDTKNFAVSVFLFPRKRKDERESPSGQGHHTHLHHHHNVYHKNVMMMGISSHRHSQPSRGTTERDGIAVTSADNQFSPHRHIGDSYHRSIQQTAELAE